MKLTLDKPSNIVSLLIFPALLVLNFILQSLHLGSEPFWYDEIVSVKATLLDFGHVKHMAEWDNNPPFYYYCLWVWEKLVGMSEYKIRLLNIVFQTISLTVVFSFIKSRFNFYSALLASLFFILHNFTITYTHEARCYTLVVMLVLISTSCFFKLTEQPTYKYAVLLGLANFLIVYSHYLAALTILFQWVLIFLFYRKQMKTHLISLLTLIILIVLRFTKKQLLLVFSFNSEGKHFWLQKADENLLITSLKQLFGGENVWIISLTVVLISIGYIYVQRNKFNKTQQEIIIYSLMVGLGSVILLFIVGQFTPVFLGRYLLFTIPFIGLIISLVLIGSPSIYLLLLPLSILILQSIYINTNPSKNMDYKLAVKTVKALQAFAPSSTVIQTKDVTALYAYYYDKNLFLDYKNINSSLKAKNTYEIENFDDFKTLNLVNNTRIILCQTYEKEADSKQIFDIFKLNNYCFVTSKAIKGVKITLIKKVNTL